MDEAKNASDIDSSLSNLKWKNPFFEGKVEDEIKIIKKSLSSLDEKQKEIMLITNYSFFDSLTSKNMNSPNKAYTIDGTTFPLTNSKYFGGLQRFYFEYNKKKK